MLAALLPSLLAFAKEGVSLLAAHQKAMPGATQASMNENPALKLAMSAVGLYQTTRDKALATGEVTAADPSVVTDAVLIAQFEGAAIQFRDHAASLLAKYSV